MSKDLYAEVIAHLLTSIGKESEPSEKARLKDLCKRVIIDSEGDK